MTGRVWGKRGTRPRVPKQTEYDYVYVFGTVCPKTGESHSLILPYCNTEMMNLFQYHPTGVRPGCLSHQIPSIFDRS